MSGKVEGENTIYLIPKGTVPADMFKDEYLEIQQSKALRIGRTL